jgi:hypothetical protein
MPLITKRAREADMAMEEHFSNSTLGVRLEAHQHAQIVSELSTIGIMSGISLAAGLLVLTIPFSNQIAISLSLLS